jgi:hypothetical protein
VRQYLTAATATWSIFGATWDDAMVARWTSVPFGMLWPEMDAAWLSARGDGDGRRPRCRSGSSSPKGKVGQR